MSRKVRTPSTMSETEKKCSVCHRMLDIGCFYTNRNVHRGDCKECFRKSQARPRPREYSSSSDESVKRARISPTPEPIIHGEHLYVMSLSTDPHGFVHGLKVGRSGNIDRRALELGSAMPFHLLVLATFRGHGHLEDQVHATLASSRNHGGRGREWFHTPLSYILHAVGCAMQAQSIVNGARGSEPDTGTPWNCPALAGSEEEGPGHYSEASGELCEEEGEEAGVPGCSTCDGQDGF